MFPVIPLSPVFLVLFLLSLIRQIITCCLNSDVPLPKDFSNLKSHLLQKVNTLFPDLPEDVNNLNHHPLQDAGNLNSHLLGELSNLSPNPPQSGHLVQSLALYNLFTTGTIGAATPRLRPVIASLRASILYAINIRLNARS